VQKQKVLNMGIVVIKQKGLEGKLMSKRNLTALCIVIVAIVAVAYYYYYTTTLVKPITLGVIAAAEERPHLDRVAKIFKEKTGIEVKVTTVAWDQVHDKIVSAAAAGSTEYDVIYIDTIWPAEFAKAGIIIPLEDYIERDFPNYRDELIGPCLAQMEFGGHVWGFPRWNEAKFLFYNYKMLEEAGFDHPPRTWTELINMSKVLMEKGICKYGIAFGWKQTEGLICDTTVFIYGFGGQWNDEKGNWVFNKDGAKEAIQFMYDLIYKYKIADPASIDFTDRTVCDVFVRGDTAFMIQWTYGWRVVQDPTLSKVVDQVKVTLIPGVEGRSISSSCTGGGGWAIMKNSLHKDEAWELLKLLVSSEEQEWALRNLANMPTWKHFYEDPKILEDYPIFASYYPQYQYAHWRPIVEKYTEWSYLTQVAIHKILTGEKDVETALDEVAAELNEKGIKAIP